MMTETAYLWPRATVVAVRRALRLMPPKPLPFLTRVHRKR